LTSPPVVPTVRGWPLAPAAAQRLAHRLGLGDQMVCVGGRNDLLVAQRLDLGDERSQLVARPGDITWIAPQCGRAWIAPQCGRAWIAPQCGRAWFTPQGGRWIHRERDQMTCAPATRAPRGAYAGIADTVANQPVSIAFITACVGSVAPQVLAVACNVVEPAGHVL
jgi:hypothetical protein